MYWQWIYCTDKYAKVVEGKLVVSALNFHKVLGVLEKKASGVTLKVCINQLTRSFV